MNPPPTRSKWSMVLGPFTFHARESFIPSRLPNMKEVVERMIWFLVPRPKGSAFLTSKEWAATQVAEELCEHWIWCNVLPKYQKNVTKMILKIYEDFKKILGFNKSKQTENWVQDKVIPYMESLEQGLDIRTMDADFRKKQEETYGVKETQDEESFLEDQIKGKRVGHCDGFVDRKWLAQDARRRKEVESYQKRLNKSEQGKLDLVKVAIPDEYDDPNQNSAEAEDGDYEDEGEEDMPGMSKKRKRSVNPEGWAQNCGELPDNFRHIRHGVKKVRPEYYTAVDRCISELHMSKEQAIGSTIIIAKELFQPQLEEV